MADPARPRIDADVEEAWLTELDKRSASLGTAQTIDSKTVHAEVRAALRARRAARP